MAFSFNKLAKSRKFTHDFSKCTDYTNLETLYNSVEEGTVFQIKGVFINDKSQFADESPLVALNNVYVNLPNHQLAEVKEMLASEDAIRGINAGAAGFTIETYDLTRTNSKGKNVTRTYYKAVWCDCDPRDFDDEEEVLEDGDLAE